MMMTMVHLSDTDHEDPQESENLLVVSREDDSIIPI